MKILVVEDDRHLNKAICDMIRPIAEPTAVYNGDDAIYQAEQNIHDLVILDVMLPGHDGFEILQKIRSKGTTPVIMLTARDSVSDKVKGLKLGADDYMTKPFYRDELIARVNALLRRYNNGFDGETLSFKDLRFDRSQKRIYLKDEQLDITGKSYGIMEYLITNKDMIVTKEQLFNRVWGFESETIWSVVEVYVSNLRKLLKKYGYDIYLKTLRNVGYMWSDKE